MAERQDLKGMRAYWGSYKYGPLSVEQNAVVALIDYAAALERAEGEREQRIIELQNLVDYPLATINALQDRLAQAERERDELKAFVDARDGMLSALTRELGAARAAADAAATFWSVDKVRLAHLRGCVMPDPTDAWVAARDKFRRTADAWAALAAQSSAKEDANV